MHESKLAGWTPEQIAAARGWVLAWQAAGPELERLMRAELRRLEPTAGEELRTLLGRSGEIR